jgi:P-type conjugative transfer protein TrbJ
MQPNQNVEAIMKQVVIAIPLILVLSIPINGYSLIMYCTNCSDIFTQALEHTTSIEQLSELYSQVDEAIKQTEQQIELVQQTIKQYENMVQNATSLPNSIKSKITGTFNKLSSLSKQLNTHQGDASTLSQVFSSVYSGSSSIRSLAKSTKDSAASAAESFDEMRQKWAEEVDRGQQSAFQEAGINIKDIQEQASDLETQIGDLLNSPDGQEKALEAGNQLSAMQLLEARKLRSLLSTQAQATVAKAMKEEKNDQAVEALTKEFFKTDKIKNYNSKDDPF